MAIEALDLLEEYGIHVDQVILRGSPVQEAALTNVTRVDYITSKFDYYYSYDSNPNDSVVVQQHKVNFWGHTLPTSMVVVDVAELMMSLMVNGGGK